MDKRYYYKDKANNYYSLKSERKDDDLISITQEEYENRLNGTKASSKELTSEEKKKIEYRREIVNLKKSLSETDYQAIKFAEGELSEDEYREMKAKRRQWRAAINSYEQLLSK